MQEVALKLSSTEGRPPLACKDCGAPYTIWAWTHDEQRVTYACGARYESSGNCVIRSDCRLPLQEFAI